MEDFYSALDGTIMQGPRHLTIVIGDFNGKVGVSDTACNTFGKFGLGARNRNGGYLVDFAVAHQLSIMNTFFKKRPERKWTWMGPNGSVKNEIDYILCNCPHLVQDVEVINRFNTGSDHRLLRAKLIMDTKQDRKKRYAPKLQTIRKLQCSDEEFWLLLQNRFELLSGMEDIDEIAAEMTKGIHEVAEEMKGSPR